MFGKIIGQGRSASVFEYEEDKVIKLYKETIDVKWIEREYKANKLAIENNAFVPKVFSLLKKDNQYGIVFEKVDGKTLSESIPKYLFKIKRLGQQFAQELLKIHSIKIMDQLPKINYLKKIDYIKNLSDVSKKELIKYTNTLTSSSVLCHGDYHVENILITKDKFFVIDWMNAHKGSPEEDIARSILLLETPYGKEDLPYFIKKIVKPIIRSFKKAFLTEYFLKSNLKQSDIDKWMAPVAALRLLENVPGEEEWLKDIIKNHISNTILRKTR